jgi:hypothetical protein
MAIRHFTLKRFRFSLAAPKEHKRQYARASYYDGCYDHNFIASHSSRVARGRNLR